MSAYWSAVVVAATCDYSGRASSSRAVSSRKRCLHLEKRDGAPAGSLAGDDFVTDANRAAAHDLRAEATSVHERLQQPVLAGVTLQVLARLTQPHPAQDNVADPEVPIHKFVQVDAARRHVAARLTRRELDAVVTAISSTASLSMNVTSRPVPGVSEYVPV